jgi:hypothetical protein
VLVAHEDELDERFAVFFPQLQGFVGEWIENARSGPTGLGLASRASGGTYPKV